MTEKFISRTKVFAIASWAAVSGLMLSAFAVVLATEHWEVGMSLLASSCAMSAVATTVTIKIYNMRLCALIRLAHGLDSAHSAELHPIR